VSSQSLLDDTVYFTELTERRRVHDEATRAYLMIQLKQVVSLTCQLSTTATYLEVLMCVHKNSCFVNPIVEW